MADRKKLTEHEADRATALSALAAARRQAPGTCLGAEEMAALVAGNLEPRERQHCLDHLAHCQACYDTWRELGLDEMTRENKLVKGPWYRHHSLAIAATGSVLAAAASLLLYLNLGPPTVMEAVPPGTGRQEQRARVHADRAAPPASQEEAVLAEKAAPPPATEADRPQFAKKKEIVPPAQRQQALSQRGKGPTEAEDLLSAPAAGGGRADSTTSSAAMPAKHDEEMIDINSIIPVTMNKLRQMQEGDSLVLQTYKRDRLLQLTLVAHDQVLIREQGFGQQEFAVDRARLKKALKPLIKREFPRSNKVRVSVRKAE